MNLYNELESLFISKKELTFNDLEKGTELAFRLIGLKGWKVKKSRALTFLGACKPHKKEIVYSTKFLGLISLENWIDTIIHEVSHAIVPEDGHGSVWKAKMISFGVENPQRVANHMNIDYSKLYKYSATCPTCGKVYYKQRKSNGSYYCNDSNCKGVLFTDSTLLSYSEK